MARDARQGGEVPRRALPEGARRPQVGLSLKPARSPALDPNDACDWGAEDLAGELDRVFCAASGALSGLGNPVARSRLLRRMQEKAVGTSSQFDVPPFAAEPLQRIAAELGTSAYHPIELLNHAYGLPEVAAASPPPAGSAERTP